MKIRTSSPLDSVVCPPGSKSITNRALILGALAEGVSTLEGALDSEDTRVMRDSLRILGVNIVHEPENNRMIVAGTGGRFPNKQAELYVGNSGTTARFLTAALCFSDGNYRIHGKPRMHERPIGDLLFGLNQLGGSVVSEAGNGCPPILIEGIHGKQGLNDTAAQFGITSDKSGQSGRFAAISGTISSQFLSAILLASPSASDFGDVEIHVVNELVSRPYVRMTLAVMKAFGVDVTSSSGSTHILLSKGTSFITPKGSKYAARNYEIEPDASAASYFFAAAAITGGKITVRGLSDNSLQGDMDFVYCLRRMGCRVSFDACSTTVEGPDDRRLAGISVDMNEISDTVQTLAVVALFASEPTRITNVAHIRAKETDRISATVNELRKFGATVEELPDGLIIHPPLNPIGATIETYDDHRMAMSFAIAGLRIPDVVILNPECVAKTFPKFFEDLESITR